MTEQDESDRIRFTGRRLARVIALEVIYRNELLNESLEDALQDIVERMEIVEEDVRDFARQLVETYGVNREDVDKLLEETAEHWAMDRMHDPVPTRQSAFNVISDEVLPALRQRGVDEAQIDQMLAKNPRRIFECQAAY